MIQPTNKSLTPLLQAKIDNLNKPKGSLGRLESLALQIGLIQQTTCPTLRHPCHLLFAGDHGIEREGVSASPREVTWQQVENYGKGGGGINMFCRQHQFDLRVIDVGVDHDFDLYRNPHIVDRKIAYGTNNFLYEPAMSENAYRKAMLVGAEQVKGCYNKGCNVVSIGEMGIGNTSPSSILMHLFLHIDLEKCVGAGSGLGGERMKHKYNVLNKAVDNFHRTTGKEDVETVIRYFAGFEMVAAIGAMLKAAELGMVILVDGFIMTACMLAASLLAPNIMDYAIFCHQSDEGGHKLMLEKMQATPLLNLGMRLGEGTGAVCAYPLLQSAVNMLNEMDNFAHANITKYF
ncbi:MAG: nicotinate-nucleotide--dimethylbenzimidazole phosphoribosyltransferase [Paludibacteraceae bacterium]|nr:nicotinate-nucleotide--dimethylbenzimidazole phosphoribosyltransferase [Paludibacteraceae bacterium]